MTRGRAVEVLAVGVGAVGGAKALAESMSGLVLGTGVLAVWLIWLIAQPEDVSGQTQERNRPL